VSTHPAASLHLADHGGSHQLSAFAHALAANVNEAVRGKPEPVALAVAAVLAGGHVLIEDVPGVGKTLLAKSLAQSLGGTFQRVQGTSDLLPSDITGVTVYDQERREWRFRRGAVFANVLLVDEINRATPRAQSALLEAMEERQVTVDGSTYPLPSPFIVLATQNPLGSSGTFPLVEGQLDRFAVVLSLGRPTRVVERALLLGDGGVAAMGELRPVASPNAVASLLERVYDVHCAPAVADYVLDIIGATRDHPSISLGASPRASLSLLAVARGIAVTRGRDYVVPDDVKAATVASLAHRIVLTAAPDLGEARRFLTEVVRSMPVPA
jgi:MoxR-like ATPase